MKIALFLCIPYGCPINYSTPMLLAATILLPLQKTKYLRKPFKQAKKAHLSEAQNMSTRFSTNGV